jgi:hypothetical protein
MVYFIMVCVACRVSGSVWHIADGSGGSDLRSLCSRVVLSRRKVITRSTRPASLFPVCRLCRRKASAAWKG